MKKRIFLLSLICMVVVFFGCSSEYFGSTVENEKNDLSQWAVETEKNDDQTDKDEILKRTIVVDPGHSSVVTGELEPIGPGASEMKLADTSGTSGVSTGVPEYELTLKVSQKLKFELENRGYNVILTRESNDVPLSCVERSTVANEVKADAFVRIHANGSEDSTVHGAMTICTTPNNPYYPEMYFQSRALSDYIINTLCEITGCKNNGVWETDSMSGNNWSQVPVTIVEIGYMTNAEEDERMENDEYQEQIAAGIANGIDEFIATL